MPYRFGSLINEKVSRQLHETDITVMSLRQIFEELIWDVNCEDFKSVLDVISNPGRLVAYFPKTHNNNTDIY